MWIVWLLRVISVVNIEFWGCAQSKYHPLQAQSNCSWHQPREWVSEWSPSVMSTLCDLMDCSLSGSSVHGIFQARVLEWVAISFSRRSSQPRNQTCVSCVASGFFPHWAIRKAPIKDRQVTKWKWKWSCSVVSDSATSWSVAYQAPLSMGFSRQEFWSGLPFPSPGDLPIPGTEPRSPTL